MVKEPPIEVKLFSPSKSTNELFESIVTSQPIVVKLYKPVNVVNALISSFSHPINNLSPIEFKLLSPTKFINARLL